MEGNSCDKVDMLEAAETFLPGDMPQSYCLIHGGGQDEIVLGKGEKTHIYRLTTKGREYFKWWPLTLSLFSGYAFGVADKWIATEVLLFYVLVVGSTSSSSSSSSGLLTIYNV